MTGKPQSYFHRGGNTPLLGSTITEHFRQIVQHFPEHEALVSLPQKRRFTYQELNSEVDVLARGLLGLGYGHGDRIGIWSTNNTEWVTLQLATARLGIVLVNINPAYRSRELAYALEISRLQGLVTIPRFRSSNYLEMLVELLPDLKTSGKSRSGGSSFPQLRNLVVFDPADSGIEVDTYPGLMSWPALLAAGQRVTQQQLDEASGSLDRDDPINIQFTSGTTGFPKAVVLSHHNILNNAYFSARAMNFDERDRLCIPVPFYHCFGMVLANLLCISVGACMVIPCEHFDASAALRAIETERCTAIHGVPTMFIAELDQADFNRYDLSSLRTGIMAGAPCPASLMRRVMQDMHCPEILIGYGETEASPLTHLTTAEDDLLHRTETVGRNLPHQEVKVVDVHTGATLPWGETGEICFRGYHIMSGYYQQEDKTAEAIDSHGWLHSGDLGTMDRDGYLRITGRRKEMIIRGGENIYPREIEMLLFDHPAVAQAAVFGVPDSFYGEEIMAWIQLKTGQQISEEELRDYLRGQLSHFKVPRYLWFVKEFPMTVTGKLQKFRMQEIALQKLHTN